MQLPEELRNSKKGLINIKNKDNECFHLCHIRTLNSINKDEAASCYRKVATKNNISTNYLEIKISRRI